ncbi:hypothetical protein BC831DRAFT_457095 [Entophlyctis helioformis]|nr:hypothetical protein BC831DRAFT_457095 [Entophlyctis helioformis]
MAHPATQQGSCKQVVLLFAAAVCRVSNSTLKFQESHSDLCEDVRTASASGKSCPVHVCSQHRESAKAESDRIYNTN